MSDNERTGTRDLTYSAWHRMANIRRYLDPRQAWSLGYVDIDSCEYCRHCWQPLALIETQMSDRRPKDARVTQALALLAGIPAFSVSYVPGDQEQIALFRVRQLAPDDSADDQPMLPAVYAYWLWSLRLRHQCASTREAAS